MASVSYAQAQAVTLAFGALKPVTVSETPRIMSECFHYLLVAAMVQLALGLAALGLATSAAASQVAKGGSDEQAAKPSWSAATIRMEHDVYRVGDRIRLFVDSANISGKVIRIDAGASVDLIFPVQIRDEKGSLAPETKWGRRVRTGKDEPGERTIVVGKYMERAVSSGETHTSGILLNGLYDLKQPGKYTAQVVKVDEKGKVVFESNIVTFTVTK